jgi:hypothetical protein
VTFDDIKRAIKSAANLTSDEADVRVGESINQHYRRVTSMIGMDATRFVTRSEIAPIGSQNVTFTEIEKIDRIIDTTDSTSIRVLQEVSLHQQRSTQPGTGQPSTWALQNTDASAVTVRLDTLPQSEYTLQADGWASLADLQGNDEPAFPQSFHNILVWFVLEEELLRKEKDKLAAIYHQKAETLVSDLRFHLADSPTLEVRQGSADRSTMAGASGGGSGSVGGTAYTQTALLTFNRGAGFAPFAVAQSDAAVVNNLDSDKLDGEDGTYYLDRANHTGAIGSTLITLAASDRLIGRDTTGGGASEELTVSGGLEFTGSGGIRTSAFTGDVTKTAGGTATTIAAGVVTYAKMQDASAASRLLGRGSASGSGDIEEISLGAGLSMSTTTVSNTHAASQTANTVLAGPTTGSAAAPTFRALVAADVTGLLAMTRLGGGSGTDTTASATSVSTVAISGLTALDTLLVYYSIESVTQDTANVVLYNTTDNVTMSSLTAGSALTAGGVVSGHGRIHVRQGGTVTVRSVVEGFSTVRLDDADNVTFTTGWTGSWSLQLRHGGVTSGGTFKYVWNVYKVLGQ